MARNSLRLGRSTEITPLVRQFCTLLCLETCLIRKIFHIFQQDDRDDSTQIKIEETSILVTWYGPLTDLPWALGATNLTGAE